MDVDQLKKSGVIYTPIIIVLFTFFIPISPTLKSIFLWLSIVPIILNPYFRRLSYRYTWQSIWCLSAVALFTFIAISSLWSPASNSLQFGVIIKYVKILYIPVLAVAFINRKYRLWSLNAYLAAAVLTCILSILKARGWLSIGHTADQGAIFLNHIFTGFVVSFASYLAGLFFFQTKGWLRVIYLIILLLTSYQLIFINTGRTGYVLYIALMIMLFLQKLSLKQAILGVVLVFSLFVLSYNVSIMTHLKLKEVINDVVLYQQNNKSTSLGLRIEFQQYAQSLLVQHPMFGVGAGGFEHLFYQSSPVPNWGKKLTDPHSQYWLILAEQGIIGFMLLLFFFVNLFITALKLKETKPILLGFLCIFFIGCLSDSILCYSIAGYLLVLFSALSFGELIEVGEAQRPLKDRVLV